MSDMLGSPGPAQEVIVFTGRIREVGVVGDIGDTHIALTGVVGGALAVMRSVLDRRHGADADAVFAEGVLRSLGLAHADAHEIVSRPLPEVGGAADQKAA